MRLRESILLKGENFDLETANCDLLSPSLLQGDEEVDTNGRSLLMSPETWGTLVL